MLVHDRLLDGLHRATVPRQKHARGKVVSVRRPPRVLALTQVVAPARRFPVEHTVAVRDLLPYVPHRDRQRLWRWTSFLSGFAYRRGKGPCRQLTRLRFDGERKAHRGEKRCCSQNYDTRSQPFSPNVRGGPR